MKQSKLTVTGSVFALSLLALSGCSEAEQERAESQAEQTMERAEEKAEAAGEYAERKADDAGDYMSDAAITTKVKAALFEDGGLSSTDISVETEDGIVTLTGTVESDDIVDRADELAGAVDGVLIVKNDLEVAGE